ncbi:MAG: solute carrier family 23 protein [Tunicatimonas sp.]|uniref:SulP family inorganic anion transporter n=1 Tax=Tunicatimonas sp. TaxID=1940096 RepID=UPI003C71605C
MIPINPDQIPPDGWQGFKRYWRTDLVAALSVALVALPLGLGIAVAAGFPPMSGLISVIVGGLVTTFIRGSHVGINGPANALIIVALSASESMSLPGQSGLPYTMAVFVVSGGIQAIMGLLRLGKLGNLVPTSTIHGMLAAIGFLIIGTQIHHALGISDASFSELLTRPEILLQANPFIITITIVCLAILVFYKDIENRTIKLLPAPMWVLIVAIPLFFGFRWLSQEFYPNTEQLSNEFLIQIPTDITQGLAFPDFSRINEPVFWLTVFIVTIVLSLESLVISKAVDKLDPYKRKTNLNKDLFGIGVATVVSGFLGGLPITAVIARSSVNITNGATTRWSNFMHGLIVLLFVVVFTSFIQKVPLAALAAILLFTGYMLTSPRVYKRAYQQGWEQLTILVVTLVAILLTDLMSGLLVGIGFTLLLHFFRSGMPLPLFLRYMRRPYIKVVQEKEQSYLLKIKGIINFTNILQIQNKIKKLNADDNVVIDFSHARVVDYTVLEYLHEYAEKYNQNGGEFHFTGLDVHKTSSHHPYALHVLEKPKPKLIRLTRRQVELKQLAASNKWGYNPEVAWDIGDLNRFLFFKPRPVEYMSNQISGNYPNLGVQWKIGDVSLKDAFISFETYRLTVEVLSLPFILPIFSLEEESFLDRISVIAAQQDIDFNEYRNFSRKFLLQGTDEAGIRALFTANLIHFLEKSDIYHLESNGKELLIFRHLRIASPREILKMVAYSKNLVTKLHQRTTPPTTKTTPDEVH